MRRAIRVLRERFAGRAAFDTAVSRATLECVASGALPETLRLYRPDPILAFARQDAHAPGFGVAVSRARDFGFEPVLRLAGGRAAVYHEATLALAWSIPDPAPRERIGQRFDEVAAIARDALCALGVDARVGLVAGEYCPGAHSVNARGERKLVGVGQRLIRGAAHVGAVIVVGDAARIRSVLEPVYAALGLVWRPESVGSVADETPRGTLAEVERALLSAFADRYELRDGVLDGEVATLAERLAPQHALSAREP